MGLEDSPLRDRVLFVEGAPRSGTTAMAVLLTGHRQIAGRGWGETHLFDIGLDRLFDNYAGTGHETFLSNYLSRSQLVDLARNLADGVLLAVRDATKPDARYVLEKTPLAAPDPRLQIQRKLDVYPDAWYLQIVRDGDAVVRSLLQTPMGVGKTADDCRRWWRESIDALREVVGDSERYCEVNYDDIVAEPVATVERLAAWLGLDFDASDQKRVLELSRARFSQFEPHKSEARRRRGAPGLARRVVRRARAGLRDTGKPTAPPEPDANPTFVLLGAARDRDGDGLRAITADDFTFEVRSTGGDLEVQGEAARDALISLFARMFERPYLAEWWHTPHGSGPGTVDFYGVTADGDRVDVAFLATVDGDRVARLKMVCAGDPVLGREPTAWVAEAATRASE